MRFGFILIFTLFFSISCHNLSNRSNDTSKLCGVPADSLSSGDKFITFVDSDGSRLDAQNLRFQNLDFATVNLVMTPRGCVQVDSQLNQTLIVSDSSSNSGKIITPEDLVYDGFKIVDVRLKKIKYRDLDNLCPKPLQNENIVNFDLSKLQSAGQGLLFKASVKVSNETIWEFEHLADPGLNGFTFDMTDKPDQLIEAVLLIKQLFTVDQSETKQSCKVTLDRQSPIPRLKLEEVIVGFEGGLNLLDIGSEIPHYFEDRSSDDTLYFCIQPSNKDVNACEPEIFSSENRPVMENFGVQKLYYYGKDKVGNTSSVFIEEFVVVDKSSQDSIRKGIENANRHLDVGEIEEAQNELVNSYGKFEKFDPTSKSKGLKTILSNLYLELAIQPLAIFKRSEFDNFPRLDSWEQFTTLKLLTGESCIFVDTKISEFSEIDCFENLLQFQIEPNGRVVQKLDDNIEFVFMPNGTFPVFEAVYRDEKGNETFAVVRTTRGAPNNGFQSILLNPELNKELVLESNSSVRFFNLNNDNPRLYVKKDDRISIINPNTLELDAQTTELFELRRIKPWFTANDSRVLLVEFDDGIGTLSENGLIKLDFNTEYNQHKFSESNQTVIISDKGNYYRVFDVATGKLLGEFYNNENLFNGLSISDTTIAHLSNVSRQLSIMTFSGRQIRKFVRSVDQITSALLSPTNRLAIQTQNNKLVVFDLEQSLASRFTVDDALINSLTASSNGFAFRSYKSKYSDGYNVEETIYQLNESGAIISKNALNPYFSAMSVSGNYSLAENISVLEDNGVVKFLAETGRSTLSYLETDNDSSLNIISLFSTGFLTDFVQTVKTSADGSTSALSGTSGHLSLIDNQNERILGILDYSTEIGGGGYQKKYPKDIAIPNNRKDFLFIVDTEGKIRRIDIDSENGQYLSLSSLVPTKNGKPLSIGNLKRFSKIIHIPDSDTIVACNRQGELVFFDFNLIEKDRVDLVPNSPSDLVSMKLSPDGKEIFVGSYDGTWRRVNLSTMVVSTIPFMLENSGAKQIALSKNGKKVALSDNVSVYVLDLDFEYQIKKVKEIGEI